jgi:hypothetical protein
MDSNFYFKPNHGLGFAFQDEATFKNSTSIFSFDLHYVYRHFITERLNLNFEPGLGWQSLLSSYSCRNCNQELSSAFMLDYRVMFQWVFHRWRVSGIDLLDFYIGTGIVHQWAPSIGGRVGGLFRIGMGF